MKIIDNIKELKEEINKLKGSIGLVPTMGALHDGHLSLIKKSVMQNENTIVSIFFFFFQFGVNEDLDKYPRQLKQDASLCEKEGVNIIFAPKVSEMYSCEKNNLTLICPPYEVVDKLCGKSRPGHFDGVCSVVAKLFNLTKATRAYFGQKDAQQLFIVKKMVKDLNFDTEIVPCPIVREEDNLALSSRNQYLTENDRKLALNISKALFNIKKLFKEGISDIKVLIDASLKIMDGLDVEYIEFVDKNTFDFQTKVDRNTLVLIAARVPESKTRLIDNIDIWE